MQFFRESAMPASAFATAHRLLRSLRNAIGYQHEAPWQYADYEIDPQSAFFPREPLATLPDPFDAWEAALEEAPSVLRLSTDADEEALALRLQGARWRQAIRTSPVLSVASLKDTPSLQRAHFVLASLVHWFAHSNTSSEVPIHIPRSLAVPLVDVSRRLRVAPVLTFADTILWNWDLASSLRSDQPLSVDNMKFTNIFSRTEDESNFYIASAQAEFIGIEALHIMHAYSRLSVVQDDASVSQIAEGLTRMAEVVDHISAAVHDIRQMVNPRVFYDEVRPWFVGSTADRPWIYDGVDEQDLDLDGPSSGQSAIMHSLDVFLDVNHGTPKRPSPDPLQRGAVSGGFMQRMRRYMPGNQRDFLERLEVEHLGGSEHPVRDLARTHPQIRGPYNQAIRALTRLRDHHIRVATLYIVSMAKSAPMCPFIRGAVRQAEAIRTASAPAKGTGGNHVSTLLKAGRDATRRAVLAA